MRRFTGVIFVVLSMMLLAACGGTQEPVTYTSLEQLQDLNGGNLPVTERDAEGHITSFEGIISDFNIENEEQARLAFEGVLTIFDIDSPDYTFETSYQKWRGNLLVDFKQYYKGAYVEPSNFQMVVDSGDNRTVTITNNLFYGCEEIDMSSIITAEQAKEYVSEYRRGEVTFEEKEPFLLITDMSYGDLSYVSQDPNSKVETTGTFPAWDVYIKAGGGFEEIYVNALTGEIVNEQFRGIE